MRIKHAGFWGKARGLMFTRKKNFDYALIFDMKKEDFWGLHMLFVFFPIDVLYLDKDYEVVEKATLEPFSLGYVPKKKARFIVELPLGASNEFMRQRVMFKSGIGL